MVVGTLVYLVFSKWEFLSPAKPFINSFVSGIMPWLIFAQLLFTFCRIDMKELRPKRWHLWLLMIQFFSCAAVAALLYYVPMGELNTGIWQGMMVCLICPTATAAAVITSKLGGNAASLTTYTLLSNLLGAVMVPLVFPLVEPHDGLTFWMAFLKILSKVFPLLLSPLLVAWFLKHCVKRVHRWLMVHSGVAFYIWAFALAMVMGQTARSLINSDASAWLIALGGLAVCVLQFAVGKRIGSAYGDRISAGQALGQKNTVLAIWMATAYLHPMAVIAPGSYVLWQNLINSYQLWKKRKRTAPTS
jgi:BASS family bile acid:Na+ symporter